jgi:hypothetical protein
VRTPHDAFARTESWVKTYVWGRSGCAWTGAKLSLPRRAMAVAAGVKNKGCATSPLPQWWLNHSIAASNKLDSLALFSDFLANFGSPLTRL